MFAKYTKEISKRTEKTMNALKSSNLLKSTVELGKMLVICLVIYQLFTQPIAALAQSRNILEVTRAQQTAAKSKIKPKADEEISEGFLPDIEKRARKTVSDALGMDIPLPQVFGENGKLQALLGGGANKTADKNREMIEAALKETRQNRFRQASEKPAAETAVSLRAPILNRGLIAGSLRVLREVPFNLGGDFRITENLYTAGSPDIRTRGNSEIRSVVNEESDDLSKNYPLYLNGAKIDGNIHIHSAAENIFREIPLGLPAPTGSENIEINSADDLKNIKDWKSVRNLTVNASGLTIEVPAGNYEKFTLNAPNKLVLAGGDYNFAATLELQKGSALQIDGQTTIGIARNLQLEDVSVKRGERVAADSFKINVLGSSVVLSGRSEIEGALRAVAANVVLNEGSKITGQVIAGSLVMNGGTIAEPAPEGNRVFGLKQYTRTSGAPNNFTDNFPRGDCQAPYTLKIYNGSSQDGSNRVSSATVKLNGAQVVAQNAFSQNVPYIERSVNLKANNKLDVRLSSVPGSFFNLEITGAKCGNSDTTAPVLAITAPQNNSTTTALAIDIQGTASDETGISQILVNETQATFNETNNTWNLLNFPLNLGANQITVKAIDNAGNQSTQTITITRQPAVVDVTAPVLTISTPANNAVVEAQTITVTGTATDSEANASGLAGVTVNGQNVNLSLDGSWTISDVALNIGSNPITARAVDNAGNISTQTITVVRQESDTQAPSLAITAPGNNSETTAAAITVSGTVTDAGTNPSGVASVTVNGQAATVNGSSWTIENVSLTLGANTIIANAIDNAGNSTSAQITVTRIEPDTAPPTIAINSPLNNSETNDATVDVNGTVADTGANASGVASLTVNGQNVNFSGGNWSVDDLPLAIGANTITVKATDVAGNEATGSVTIIRLEPDTQAPTVSISAPANNFETISETITVQGTVTDNGTNTSGIQSVTVGGVTATLNGNNWTAAGVPLNLGTNTLTAVARDNNNNTGSATVTVVRNPPDTQAPVISITAPANNFETFDPQVVVSGTVSDTGAGATGVASVTVGGAPANYNPATGAWSATVTLADGANTIVVTAIDNAPVPNQAQSSVQVTKIAIQPPTLTITNPQNGAFLSANSVTIAGSVGSNKPDMTFTVTVGGEAANLAGREFTKTFTLSDGANVVTVVATDALGQQAQQSITVTNDRTPPTVLLTNVPQVVNPGESYTIGAVAADAYGISDVEFTVDGASITRTAAAPYQFTLNIPLNQAPNQNLNISAIARDNAGLSATATARVVTSGPSGLTGYVFDDATGYVLPLAVARLNAQTPVPTDENGLYSFVSTSATGNILITKEGYTAVERGYSATAGSGVEVFDARLTPLDSKANTADVNGGLNAGDAAGKIQVQFAPGSFVQGTDVRVTSVSPQGLANLLPFGWSPIPDAVVDIRAANETGISNRAFANPATLNIPQIAGLSASIPVVLARYNSATHAWTAVQTGLTPGANGGLQASIPASGQYAFLVADTGATAPAAAVIGENLPAAAPANSEQLDAATASATASPATALYSANAKSRISFIANSATKLPSGISIEASFSDSYLTIIDRNYIAVDRPSQDFVLYAFPSVSATEPNKLGAYFVAKPVRTDFGLTDLLNAKVHVDIRSGRLSQSGILIGQTGGTVRGSEGSQLDIPGGAVGSPQVVFFNKIPNDQAGVILPEGYELVGAFDINLAGGALAQSARISMPAGLGDNSKIVLARVISIAGLPGLKVTGRVTENDSRLESTVSAPAVPAGVNLAGVVGSGKYVFVRMPAAFGYVQGTVSSTVANTQSVKVTNTQTPFVDLVPNNAVYTIIGLANGENNQVDAASMNNDATGYGVASTGAQDAVSNLPISLSSAVLNVQAVTPTGGAQNVVVTTPVTVTFNKPIQGSTVTGSNIKLVTASGNPVISTLTVSAGGRSVILTPSSNLQSGTDYKLQVSTGIRDLYGNALASAFESTFRTASQTTVSGQLQPAQIRLSYPNEQGLVTISIPAGVVPSGSLIFAVNNSTGSTVSTVAGSTAIELLLPARVGDEIELIIRQPDGTEYRVKQGAYRRADGFVSVGSNGGTITSEDGTITLHVPAGAITGQADVKMTSAPESSITAPRTGAMSPEEMAFAGGVQIEARGNFTNNQELHLELPSPANLEEGQRGVLMKPANFNYENTSVNGWETITSTKVEDGKIKTTSPPFMGVTLVGVIVGLSIFLSVFAFIPRHARAVTGLVRKQKTDGTYETVSNGICVMRTLNGEVPEIMGIVQQDGKFTIAHTDFYYPQNANIPITCMVAGERADGIAFPYNSTGPGLGGFTVRYANIIYPSTSIVNQPAQILISGATLDEDNRPVPADEDPLKLYGKVQVGTKLGLSAAITPAAAEITEQKLYVNGVSQNLQLHCENGMQGMKECGTLLPTPVAGRYSLVITARTSLNNPLTESSKTFNFIVLNNPNVRPPIAGVNPAVISVTPLDGATQIDVGTSIHIEFSEPVKNLSGDSTGGTISLRNEDDGETVGGKIYSGGIQVTSSDTARSVIDFIPNKKLKSGKNYKLVVSTDIIDTNSGDPTAVPPVQPDPDALRRLDQSAAEDGLQEFSSRFKTFQGAIITPTPISAQGYKIGVLDDYVITTTPQINGLGSSGTLKIYDSNEFLDSADPQNLQPVSTAFIPHVPLGLAVKKESFTIDGEVTELNLVAVTTLSMDTARPRNVWFYNIDENGEAHLVGVVSITPDANSGQVPNSIAIEKRRAYIGSSSNGGVYVVDIQQAIDAFRAEDNTPGDGNDYNNNAVLKAVSPNGTPNGGGFAVHALVQRAPYQSGSDYFAVSNITAITQLIPNAQPFPAPFAYVATNKQKLIGFGFDVRTDGRIGYMSGGADGKDGRVVVDKAPLPVSSFYDVKAVAGLQIEGSTKDIAVAVADSLWIFDISNLTKPKQYPIDSFPDAPQQPAKTFAELGVPVEIGTVGRQVVLEETLAYVMFDNGVGVFDISNPNDPYLTTLIRGLSGLRYLAVKDGFIYTLGSNGLNVSIGRAVAQVITYGYDPTAPEDVCGNPVVISKDERKMQQPAGIFFQLYGHTAPQAANVVIRRVEIVNDNRTETEVATVAVNPDNLHTISNPEQGVAIINGHTYWENSELVIEPNVTYTAEVVIDDSFHSKQVDIPFSNLLPDHLFQKSIIVKDMKTSQDPNSLGYEEVGSMTYLIAGNAVGVDFKVDGQTIELYDKFYKDQQNSSQPAARQAKPDTRPFGSNTDYLVPESLHIGLYPFVYKAKLKANPAYTEEIHGTVRVGNFNDDVRKPGSTMVAGVEVNSGSLALSETDVTIKGRGLSLEFSRSYNSQAADSPGTLGYGWTHNYQVSLTHFPGGYQMVGGEGSAQVFLESNMTNGSMKAEEPFLGRLVKNADGTLDYFTKAQTRYHFRQPVEQGDPNIYLGNLEYIEDPNKNRITLAYDTFGRLASVSDPANRKLTFEYEPAANVFTGISVGDAIANLRGCPKVSQFRQITKRLEQSVAGKAWRITKISGVNVGGLTVEYDYDDLTGNLISVVQNGSDSTISEPVASREWKYAYNPTADDSGNNGNDKYSHFIKSVKSPNNPENAVTKYSYFLSETAPPRVKEITLPQDNITNSFTYSADSSTNVVNSATYTDGNGKSTIYELTESRVTTITAPLGAVTTMEWTDFGQVRKTTDPEGKVTEIVYDDNQNPSTQTMTADGGTIQTVTTFDTKFNKMSSYRDGNGNVTQYSVNQLTGNVDQISLPNGRTISFQHFPNGDLKSTTDQYGVKTDFSNYDAYGNPQTISKNLGGQTQIITQTFDARSRQRSKSDSVGTNVSMEYDAFDRLIKKVTQDPSGYRNTLTIETTYLPEGQPDLVIHRDGGSEVYRNKIFYDKLQRPIKTIETASGYAGQFVRSFVFDGNSNVVSEQNRRGITITKTYNDLNHLTKTVEGGKKIWEATAVNKLGNPLTVIDLYGNQTKFVYDGFQRLVEKQLPEEVTEKTSYDTNNNVVETIDRNGNKTIYTFDELNRRASMTDALGRVTKYTYTDAEHKVEKEYVSSGLREVMKVDGLERPVQQQIVFGGNTYQTSYVYSGRDVTVTDPRGTTINQKMSGFGGIGELTVAGTDYKITNRYSALGAINQTTDGLGRVTNYVNDGLNRMTSATYNGEFSEAWEYDGDGLMTEHTDKRGFVSTFTYDEIGRARQMTTDSIAVKTINYLDESGKEEVLDAKQNQTTLEYDGLRRVRKITNPDGKSKTYVYQGDNLVSESDFKGNLTRYVYDKLKRVREITDRAGYHTEIRYSADDLTRTTVDRRGNSFTEEYDALGRLLNHSDRSGNRIVSYTYDENNNRKSQKDGNNNETTFVYDKLNRLTTITHPGGLQTETYTYDAVGNVKTHSDGRGGVTENLEYNTFNQPKRIKDGEGNITEFTYDGGNLMLSQRDPKQNLTTYKYNALGSMTEVTEAQQSPWILRYDDVQNLTSISDPLGRTVGYEHDALNRLKKINQPLGRTTRYEYDENSNLTLVQDPKGQVSRMTYNQLDKLETADYNGRLKHTYSYDAEQNLKSVSELKVGIGAARSYYRDYDERNRLSKSTDAFGKSVSFEYDAADNLKKLTDAGGRETTYSYDAKNQMDTVQQNGSTVADYDWYADGLLRRVTYSNNTTRDLVYDNADRVTKITNTIGAFAESFDYGYDANSNRISEIRKENGAARRTATFGYDPLDRLKSADYTWNVQTPNPPAGQQAVYVENSEQNTYGYDAVGNRINETTKVQSKTITLTTDGEGNTTRDEQVASNPEEATTATFNDLNELTQLNEPNGISNFTYDDNGNLIEVKKNGTVINKYEYDARNQMTRAADGFNNELAKFDYDFERKRISKTNGLGTVGYVYAGDQVVNETQNNAIAATYTVGDGEVVRSEFSGGENNFHYTDALGSVTAVSNASSSQVIRNEYNAFGEVTAGGGTQNTIGYTGQRYDFETGLMPLGNGERYYAPHYGRFIQQDSFAGSPNEPQSLNRYAYAVNNPNTHTDPSGHIAPLIILGILLVGMALGAAYSYAHQSARIADGSMAKEDFSWSNVIESAGWGGLFAGAAIIAGILAPAAVPLMIAGGVVIGGTQIIKGAAQIYAGQTNEGIVEVVFGIISIGLSVVGARGMKGGKTTVLEENVTPKSGTTEVPMNEPPPPPKQLGDGGRGNQKLLNAAPEEVLNPPKETRFIVDENGATVDLKTTGSRGNRNPIPKRNFYADKEGNVFEGKMETNFKGENVVMPKNQIIEPPDPPNIEPPIFRRGPFTEAQRADFLKGNGSDTKLAPHHRHQLPREYGGVIDEIPAYGHPEGNQHLSGVPRHHNTSIFRHMRKGETLRKSEIRQFWREKGRRLIQVGDEWFDPGF